MKSERFDHRGVYIETNRDWNGRYFIAWKPNASRIFRDTKELLKWLQWPAKTPTGDEIRNWLQLLVEKDKDFKVTHTVVEANGHDAGSFDPLAHSPDLDESDPNHNTRTII